MNNTNINNSLSRNKRLALTGAFSALVIVLGITKLGILPISPTISITYLQVPVILIVMLSGLPEGIFVGAVFGIMSLIQAAMSSNGGLDPLFVNPLVSVLPRMLVAVVSYFIWKLLKLIPHLPKAISAGITGFLGSLAHTVLVMLSLYIIYSDLINNMFNTKSFFAIIGLVGFNAILEGIASTILCSAVFIALYINKNKKSKYQD